jgi:hypothetical protein
MKLKIASTFILFLGFLITTTAQNHVFRSVVNESFKRGEKLTYKIHYGFLDAVSATIEIKEENKKFGDRNTMHIVGTGISKGSFDFFFKVRDRYESYIDEEALIPWFFGRRVDEGGYKMAQDYTFNHSKKTCIANGKNVNCVENVQDMISGFFYARSLNLGAASMNQLFTVPTIVDGEMFNLQIKFKGRETVKTSFGKIKCLKFVPVLQKGRIFKHEEDLIVWLTDDKNHIPVKAKADILFGAIKLELINFSGLANPMMVIK